MSEPTPITADSSDENDEAMCRRVDTYLRETLERVRVDLGWSTNKVLTDFVVVLGCQDLDGDFSVASCGRHGQPGYVTQGLLNYATKLQEDSFMQGFGFMEDGE
jgi:hypothetical protein